MRAKATDGELQAADGTSLRDDYSGYFGLVRDLDPGTYFVKVSARIRNPGSPETYVVHTRFDASAPDDHGDTRFDATSLALGSSVSGVSEATVDEDFFRVEVPQAGWLTVYTTGDVNRYGELQFADGTRLAFDNSSGVDFNFRIGHSVGPGTYYVKVIGFARVEIEGIRRTMFHSSHASYTVFADFFADGASDDHGDTTSDATSLALGDSVSGVIEEGDDADLFRVEVTARGSLKVYATGTLDTEGELISADGTHIWGGNDSSPVNRNFEIDHGVGRGTYYVKVESHGEARGNYVVHARFDERYPDDHGDWRANATSLVLGGSVSGVLEYYYDEDVFRVEVAQPGLLTVYTTGDTDTFGHLQFADGRPLAWDNSSGDRGNFRIEAIVDSGAHYVKVIDDPYSGSFGSYVLHARFTPDDHGDTRFEATDLALGGSVSGVIEEINNDDYFRVEVTEPGTLIVYTTGNADPLGILQASDGSVLAANDDGGEGRNFSIERDVTPGTFYVRMFGRFSSDTGNYVVHAHFVADAPVVLPPDHSDTPQQAPTVVGGQMVEGHMHSSVDVDYFRFEVPEPGIYQFTLDSEIPGLEISLQDENGNILASDRTESPAIIIAALSVRVITMAISCRLNPLCVAAVTELLTAIFAPEKSNLVTALKFVIRATKLTAVAISEELKIRSDAPFVGACLCSAIVEPGGGKQGDRLRRLYQDCVGEASDR